MEEIVRTDKSSKAMTDQGCVEPLINPLASCSAVPVSNLANVQKNVAGTSVGATPINISAPKENIKTDLAQDEFENLLLSRHSILLSKEVDGRNMSLRFNKGSYQTEIELTNLSSSDVKFINTQLFELSKSKDPDSILSKIYDRFSSNMTITNTHEGHEVNNKLEEFLNNYEFSNGCKFGEKGCTFRLEPVVDQEFTKAANRKNSFIGICSYKPSDGYKVVNKIKADVNNSKDGEGQWQSATLLVKENGVHLIIKEEEDRLDSRGQLLDRHVKNPSTVEFKLADAVRAGDSEFSKTDSQDNAYSNLNKQINLLLESFDEDQSEPAIVGRDMIDEVHDTVYNKRDTKTKSNGKEKVTMRHNMRYYFKAKFYKFFPSFDPLTKESNKIVINKSRLIENLTKDGTIDCKKMDSVLMLCANNLFTKIKGEVNNSLLIGNALTLSRVWAINTKAYCNHFIAGSVPDADNSDNGSSGLHIEGGDFDSSNLLTGKGKIDLFIARDTRMGLRCHGANFGSVETNYYKSARPLAALIQRIKVRWNYRGFFIEDSEANKFGDIIGARLRDVSNENKSWDINYNYNYISVDDIFNSILNSSVFPNAYEDDGVLYGLQDLKSNNRPYKIFRDPIGNLIKEYTDATTGRSSEETPYSPSDLYYEIMRNSSSDDVSKFSRDKPYRISVF